MPDKQLTPHFNLDEFRCKCCGDVRSAEALMLALELEPVREEYGPIIISSGFRCRKQNEKVHGALFSEHLTGNAVDIPVSGDVARFALVKLILEHGFRRIGIAQNHVHVDRGHANLAVIWTYYDA